MNNTNLPFNQTVESCSSTNDLAKQLAEQEYPHGTWISARFQEQGRGRLGRKWESVPGNLYLSYVIRDVPNATWTWVPLTIASAAVRFLRERFPTLDIRLKWPNDVWIQGAKLAGVLCEGSFRGEQSFIVAGLGLNCVGSPSFLDRETTSLSAVTQRLISADDIRTPIRAVILEEVEYLKLKGPDRVQEFYNL